MIRVCGYILGFTLVGFLLAAVLIWVSNWFAPVYPEQKARVDQLLLKADAIEAIAVGDSYNRALDFRELGLRGYHLWKGGSDIFEVHYQLRALIPRLANLRAVFIPLAFNSFKRDNNVLEGFEDIRREYYATTPTLRSFLLINGDIKNLVTGKISPLVRPDHWDSVVKSIGKGKKHPVPDLDDYGHIGSRRYKVMNRYLIMLRTEQLASTIQRQIWFSKESVRKKPEITKETYKTLVSSIKMLQRKNIRAIFYTPPHFELFNEILLRKKPDIFQLTTQYMQQIQEDFGIAYYDFSQDPAFTRNHNYFLNANHLNAYGAKVFTQKLKDIAGLP